MPVLGGQSGRDTGMVADARLWLKADIDVCPAHVATQSRHVAVVVNNCDPSIPDKDRSVRPRSVGPGTRAYQLRGLSLALRGAGGF